MEGEYQEVYIRNSRGVELFTCRWLPFSSPKALVFLCHGYGMECSGFMRECGIRLANAGYAVFGIDYEGHGRSRGARCYIKKFENIVNDCNEFFKSISAEEEYRNKCRFLYGESMGGAVSLLLHKKDPTFWNGAVLVAPMCKFCSHFAERDLVAEELVAPLADHQSRLDKCPINNLDTCPVMIDDQQRVLLILSAAKFYPNLRISEKVKPHPLVINVLIRVVEIIPKWKIVPTKDVIDSAFKDPVKREKIRSNKLIYQDKPRLKTALEMLRTSMTLEDTLHEVRLPFFVLHGEADTVTDPEVSRSLYEKASSTDKTIKLYPGMWHGLTSGEPDGNVEVVFADIITWLEKHTSDDNSVVVQTIHTFKHGILKMNGTASPPSQTPKKKQRPRKPSYFCGLRGRRLLHHSPV